MAMANPQAIGIPSIFGLDQGERAEPREESPLKHVYEVIALTQTCTPCRWELFTLAWTCSFDSVPLTGKFGLGGDCPDGI